MLILTFYYTVLSSTRTRNPDKDCLEKNMGKMAKYMLVTKLFSFFYNVSAHSETIIVAITLVSCVFCLTISHTTNFRHFRPETNCRQQSQIC